MIETPDEAVLPCGGTYALYTHPATVIATLDRFAFVHDAEDGVVVLLRVGEQLSRELRLAEVRREIIRENMRHEMSVAMNLPRGLLESVTIVLADTIADRLSEVWDQAEHIQDEWFMDPDVGVPYFG